VDVHPGPTPMLHAFGVEAQIEDVFRRTIRLPSGGSIVIDPTEALVAIDVNSGRLTEEEDLESTALKTDLEAVPEVARQLRLRDLGGVIVIDFIDLRDNDHVRQVERALREALRRDRARIRLGRMGPFGCLELTRQRIRPALLSVTHVECPTCGGAGRRRHPFGIALRVLRELRARAARSRGHGGLEVRVAPQIADLLRKRKGDSLAALEAWLTGPFRLTPDSTLPYGGWSIKGVPPRTTARPAPAAPAGGAAPGPESA
ncbi:MAG TPA: ribonuclease E/G, partial [Planctomycetota bacterium]|nr:ribonuclease E/G [Planctomycetota bacterium]